MPLPSFGFFRFSDAPFVLGPRFTRCANWAVGGGLLLAVAACDFDTRNCDGDKVSPSLGESKATGYFLRQLRPVHALRLPVTGGRVVGLHEVWLEKAWRYTCAEGDIISRGMQIVAVLDGGRELEHNHHLILRGENGLGRFNNQLYTPLRDTTFKAHYRLLLSRDAHEPGHLQDVDSVDLVSVP
jgi:hypothetical protein